MAESDNGDSRPSAMNDHLGRKAGDVVATPPPYPVEGAAQVDPRQARVLAAVKAWTGQLVDVGGRNTLLFYRDLPPGTPDLTPGAGGRSGAGGARLGASE